MSYRILQGDVRQVLKTMPDQSVQCVVTSPPYWGLRDYGMSDQLGLEPTPGEYVQRMVELFRDVKRVLRDDGTVWLNLGDSYVTSPRGNKPGDVSTSSLTNPKRQDAVAKPSKPGRVEGLKSKDLVGIPWRVAFALQDDGWYLRADIIWHKPNPMPESCTDRTTKSHEYIFLLTKSPHYFYDREAIKEVASYTKGTMRFSTGTAKARKMSADGPNEATASNTRSRPFGRNRRSVWTITSQPYKKAHFATFPEELPRLCILAGTSAKGCCAVCGKAYVRIIARRLTGKVRAVAATMGGDEQGQYSGTAVKSYDGTGAQDASAVKQRILKNLRERRTIGWQRKCRCEPAETKRIVPCVVLDLFNGSGTTGAVAVDLGRDYIGIELNPEYIALAHERIRKGVRKLKSSTIVPVDEPTLF